MNKLRWLLICLMVISAVLLDLDELAIYSPLGRLTIFDIFSLGLIILSFMKLKYFKDNKKLNIFVILIIILSFHQLVSGYVLLLFYNVSSYNNIIAGAGKYILYALITFIVTNFLIDNRMHEKFLKLWINLSLLVVIIGIFQILAVNGIPFFSNYFLWRNIRGAGTRISSTFRWQGIFVFYLGITVPLILGKIMDGRKVFLNNKNANILYLLILLLVGLFSGSRSIFLVFFSVLVMILVKPILKKEIPFSWKTILVSLLSIGPLYYITINILLPSRAFRRVVGLEGGVGVSEGVSPRQRILQSSISEWLEHPILGIGTGELEQRIGEAAHNTFLELLVENGAIGLGIYMVIVLIILNIIWNNIKIAYKTKKMLPFSMSVCMINILVYQVTASALQYRLFWIFLPLVFSYYYFSFYDLSLQKIDNF